MDLHKLGYNPFFHKHFKTLNEEDLIAGRISCVQKNIYTILTEYGEISADISGKFHYHAHNKAEFPTVGDWVGIKYLNTEKRGVIENLFPRKSVFSRKDAGNKTDEQILAANIDIAFLVSGLDGNFNIRRVERYLSIAWENNVSPVIVLNKADKCDDIDKYLVEIETVAFGVPVYPVSALQNTGLDFMDEHLKDGKTGVLLGSSGVGKTTIINSLIGAQNFRVGAIRESDSRGRHTTSFRQLVLMPSGGVLIDTPGLREIQIWNIDEGLKKTFTDIEELAAQCRFRDCKHNKEPGCAINRAIDDGNLKQERFNSYVKLQKELNYLNLRQNVKANIIEKNKWKKIAIKAKAISKRRK
jgi:ribosome biogenesis GTPase